MCAPLHLSLIHICVGQLLGGHPEPDGVQAAIALPQPQPEKVETGDDPLNLDTARRFAAVLEKEQQLMQDAQARDVYKRQKMVC